jgi:dTDP-4-amino-4,6-dideoxygalactose transaminase
MTTTTDSLAVNGGPKTRTAPWPPRRLFGEEEKQAAIALFDRAIEQGEAYGYNGPEEDAYCKQFVEYQGGKGYADMVNSGTTAVYVALRSLGIEPFTEVIVPCITDMGGCMPVALLGAIPVPADCAPGSYNIGAEQIAARITERTSAIVVAHISGLPADMDPIMELARKHNLPVVEDCAQSHGAIYKGRKVGTIGDVAAFSTMFGKHHATSGQGGVVYTRREDLYWQIRRAADRGKPFGIDNPEGNVFASLNFNQDEMGAAVGRVQLGKLESIIEGKRRVSLGLADGCEKRCKAVRIVGDPPDGRNVFWFVWAELDLDKLTVDKDTFVDALTAEGLSVTASYTVAMPHTNPWFKNRAVFGTSGFPWTSPQYKGNPDVDWQTPNIWATDKYVFRFNLHEGFTDADVADIVAGVEKVEQAYLK